LGGTASRNRKKSTRKRESQSLGLKVSKKSSHGEKKKDAVRTTGVKEMTRNVNSKSRRALAELGKLTSIKKRGCVEKGEADRGKKPIKKNTERKLLSPMLDRNQDWFRPKKKGKRECITKEPAKKVKWGGSLQPYIELKKESNKSCGVKPALSTKGTQGTVENYSIPSSKKKYRGETCLR